MARPQKEGLDYFPHDVDAVNDEKIEALRMLYGNDGYAFYFILLERIYRNKEFELDISDAETIQILSKKIGINEETFNQILSTAIKRECFDMEAYEKRGVLTSNGIKKRAGVVVEKREKMRARYEEKKKEVSDAETTEETESETPQSKVKKSKEKKSNIYNTDTPKRFIPPSLEEIQAYCRERNNNVDAQRWYDFYLSKNWMIGKNKMKDWKAAVRTWEKSDKDKPNVPNPKSFNNFRNRDYDTKKLEEKLLKKPRTTISDEEFEKIRAEYRRSQQDD